MHDDISRITKLYTDLQNGDSWVGINFKEALHGVKVTTAAKNLSANTNNIWQIVSHLIYWRTKVTHQLTGDSNPPPFSDFPLPEELN